MVKTASGTHRNQVTIVDGQHAVVLATVRDLTVVLHVLLLEDVLLWRVVLLLVLVVLFAIMNVRVVQLAVANSVAVLVPACLTLDIPGKSREKRTHEQWEASGND